jgi:3-deoxy-manno-octulosonate cytidylyltransferase (CMP-KDO synthetase)
MRILGVIPARYASTRFPGKALADLGGMSVIERVYRQAMKAASLSRVVIATDHEKIKDHVQRFGGKVTLTRSDHLSGTDRCNEVLAQQTEPYDYVINIQGDEPFIDPRQIDLLGSLLDGTTEIATLVKVIERPEDLLSSSVVKCVFGRTGRALLFSRSPIPCVRNVPEREWLGHHRFFKHIGMYGYRSDILKKIASLPLSALEKAESLEQLRWLENGFSIQVAETTLETVGIDTPADLDKAKALLI